MAVLFGPAASCCRIGRGAAVVLGISDFQSCGRQLDRGVLGCVRSNWSLGPALAQGAGRIEALVLFGSRHGAGRGGPRMVRLPRRAVLTLERRFERGHR